ncbi:MAG: alpha-L-arabinofuranosidase C-terminal domain-containing protein [Saprospiraceae bacterium]
MKKLKMLPVVVALTIFQWTAGAQPVSLMVNADQGEHTISRHIYGHFAEHLGRCIYGGFYVGEDNASIPNTNGVRNDVIKALKDLDIPNLRWPGGCFADTYHWKDGIGPKSERPTLVNRWWGGVLEDNSFGTHDFLNMCELLGTEPYMAANVGSGTVQELIDWVQYVSHPKDSPMAELRKQNGREEPWKVKFWGIGNEAWGCGGNMRPEYYADVYRKYATFTSDWSNSDGIFRIASGASDDDYHWTEVMMRDINRNLIEGIALHHYSVIDWSAKGPATGFSEEQYFTTMQRAWNMEELVTRHSTIMDRYDPQKRVALVVDEWGGWYNVEPGTNGAFLYQQNTMRDAMIAGITLNIFNNHCDRVRVANLAQTINVLQAVILTDEEKMLLTPTYHVMRMYKAHQDATLLPISLQSGEYQFGGKSLPAVHASASRDDEGTIHISLVNIDAEKENTVQVTLHGAGFEQISGEILTSAKITDHNTFDQPDKVQPTTFRRFTREGSTLNVTLPPFSVVMLTLK